jgi:hypothetical protein
MADALARPTAKVRALPAAPRPHGARRAWLLLLLLLLLVVAVAALARDQLTAAGHDLYAWCAGLSGAL